ncbi:MAG: N-acetylglucosamine-6-phosphate deacetylase [Acidimicrobiia bacterium]
MSNFRAVGSRRWDTGETTEIVVSNGVIQLGVSDRDAVDVSGLIAAPGLIDLQLNGGFGHDFTDDPSKIWVVASRLPEHGVTAFLPTIISSEPGAVMSARQVILAGPPEGWEGATPIGLHCEGPMIAPSQRGTHSTKFLINPSLDVVESWGGTEGVGMVTLAPELPHAEEVVRHLLDAGVIVAAGHSDADFTEAMVSFGWGISHGTHLFNAMSGFDHRRPGLAGALLATPSATAGIIVDGHHLHPGTVKVIREAKRSSGIALVTDAMAGMGMGDGTYRLGDIDVIVEGSRASNAEGHLAGSVLTMDEAVRNFHAFTDCSWAEAIEAASVTPASILNDPSRGRLTAGSRGDITFFDETLHVQMTVVGGRVVFDSDGRIN